MNILDIAIAKKLAGGGGGSGTDNYNDLSNLPKINDTTLSGNKSSSALGLQSEINSDSKLASDLVDDTNQDNKFVTSTEKNTWNGKQNGIDADHKINADYVDDSTSTNKFVTASDKETWNAKQNAIDNSHKLSSDLVDDTNHTNKFVTSIEKNTWNAKQNAIDADHKLSSSLVSFSTAEAAVLASGIDSAKVAQISTNQSNILSVLNRTGKNIVNIQAPTSTRGCTFVEGNNGAVTITNTTNWSQFIIENVRVKTNTQYKLVFYTDAISNLPAFNVYLRDHDKDGSALVEGFQVSNTGTIVKDFTSISDVISLNIYPDNQPTAVSGTATIRVMICEKTLYDLSNEYTWGIQNYDLTYLEAQDRASLAEVVDSGAKNLLDIPATQTVRGLTFTKDSDDWVTTNSSSDPTAWAASNANESFTLKAGTYTMVAYAKAGNTDDIEFSVMKSDSTELVHATTIAPSASEKYIAIDFTITASTTVYVMYKVRQQKGRFMLCTKAAFGVSNKFVPYRPNYDLVAQTVAHDIVFKKKSETITTANTWQVYSSLAVTLPVGKTIDITAAAEWSHNSPASEIAIIKGTTVTGTQIIATHTAPSGGQLSLCAHGMYYNGLNTDVTINIAVKYPSTENNQVSIAYRIF